MTEEQILQYAILGAGALVVIYFLSGIVRIVPQTQRLVIYQLGRVLQNPRGPGVTIVVPFLESATAVDIREKFLDIPSQTAITKDNAGIDIDFLVYYRIFDPVASKISVENVERASINIATTTLRAVIGDIDLDDVLSKRDEINKVLRSKLDEATERWGMKITTVEIREIVPPKAVMDAMTRQMSAERERRASVTKAQGERESSITIAEGERQAAILKAEGEKQSAILKAEGDRQAQVLRAQGFAAALQAINTQAGELNQNTLMLQYLEMMERIGSSPSTRFVIPMEIMGLAEKFAGMAGMNGNNMSR
jgi:regulator of protease activity HflC (stomatin/prohibitin superfamily)